ncbi:MAG: TIGR04255 family protein [Candidatus Rokuibacteriota bacterium]
MSPVTQTPKFSRPPVIETVLGVQFTPMATFSVPYYGLFWATVRDDYPLQEVKPPLVPELEEFGVQLTPATLKVMLSAADQDVRCWFMNRPRTELLQVQRDHFIRNWRKGSQDRYPGYETLKPRFTRDWARFRDFLAHADLGAPTVAQCEVTYVNQIPRGEGWHDFGDVHNVLTVVSPPARTFLPDPEMVVGLNVRYLMPDKKGRLHVAMQPAVRRDDGQLALQLTLTARGKPMSSRAEDVVAWLDMGHEWIVRGFTDLTTTEMHDLWGRTA